MKILVVNGPKLNQLGTRKPEIYGHLTLQEVESALKEEFGKDHEVDFFQSDFECGLVEKIRSFKGDILIINGGALSHHSVSLLKALRAVESYKVEVHISNVFQREEFRHKSAIASACNAYLTGFGTNGYLLAIKGAILNLTNNK
ncbi:MAG: type II 3-dehydroquinate dehydratase [Firmicutes bacterium]|nr:type II 3-dehydroquinate dehydratase [Bacillota bacterium]